MPAKVTVHGSGIAACCCAQLLARHSVSASLNRGAAAASPIVLINGSTQRLLMDVFGSGEELFAGWPSLDKRIVLWGRETSPVTLPHSGVVVPERELIERLWARLRPIGESAPEIDTWSIYSNRRTTPSQEFGTRFAHAATVTLKRPDNDACYVESLREGWLFLLPVGDGCGSLLAVGDSVPLLLAESRLIGNEVFGEAEIAGTFPAYPRMTDCITGPGWLACGTAAMGFDPICGEGAGNAVREAILAAAAVRACMAEPAREAEVLNHYSTRLRAGFHRHLLACRQFYTTGGDSQWWRSETEALDRGIAWSASLLQVAPPPKFRLNGFNLEPF